MKNLQRFMIAATLACLLNTILLGISKAQLFTLIKKNDAQGIAKAVADAGIASIINARDKEGHTPLMLAAYYGNKNIVQSLLDAGADANLKIDKFNLTALMEAVQSNKRDDNADVVSLLIGRMKPETVNAHDKKLGRTALMMAADEGLERIVKEILEFNDINVNAVDKEDGRTALMFAARKEHGGVIDILLNWRGKRGERVFIGLKDKHHKTAIDWTYEADTKTKLKNAAATETSTSVTLQPNALLK